MRILQIKLHLGVIAVVACTVATATASGSDASRTTAATVSASPQLPQALRALRTAELRIRGSKAYDIEADLLRGRKVWEVKVAVRVTRPYELDISANGRSVVRQRRYLKIDDDVRKAANARITLARAMRTAAGRARGARFDQAEIDRLRDGRLIWDVEFKRSAHSDVEVKVDARTGRVLEVDVDD